MDSTGENTNTKASLPPLTLDKTSPIPMYFQIAEAVKNAIESGALKPGQRLENEYRLSEILGVSRPTVRQAVHQLVQQGLLQRQRGVGTIIASRRIPRHVALTSLHDDLEASGRHPATVVLSLQTVRADAEIAKTLMVAEGDPVVQVERLRFADGAPLARMSNYIAAAILDRPFTSAELEEHGLYEILRAQGLKLAAAEQAIGARKASSAEAAILQAPKGSTLLTMSRVAYDSMGNVIEFGRHSYLADRYTFKMNLVAEA